MIFASETRTIVRSVEIARKRFGKRFENMETTTGSFVCRGYDRKKTWKLVFVEIIWRFPISGASHHPFRTMGFPL